MINLVEMFADDQGQSPCLWGNIVRGHACYCHNDTADAPRKCRIWACFGDDAGEWTVERCRWFEAERKIK